jgi:hypothetical protein
VAMPGSATLASPPLDLPWTLTGGRGLFGLDPVHGAILFWGALMAFTILFVVLAALLTRWSRRRRDRAEQRADMAEFEQRQLSPAQRARMRADAGELLRQAAVTAAAAKQAVNVVATARVRSEEAQRAREMAWVAFDEAQRAFEEALEHAGKQVGEQGDRQVEEAALAAFKRGDISVDELGAIFKQASGWDPMQELQAREVELRRTAESRARRLYQAAAAAERKAVTAADVAAVSAQALAEALRAELDAAMRFNPISLAAKRKPLKPKKVTAKAAKAAKAAKVAKVAKVNTAARQQPRPVKIPAQRNPKQHEQIRQVSRT